MYTGSVQTEPGPLRRALLKVRKTRELQFGDEESAHTEREGSEDLCKGPLSLWLTTDLNP